LVTDPVQRRWSAACPNCGAPVAFASSASASAVCSFCRSTLLREGEALRRIGQSAELFNDFSPLQLGARGRYAGAAFTLIGRLQLLYEGGSWNEWHALFDGSDGQQKAGWLSEDNGSFVFAFDAPLTDAPPAAETLEVGAQAALGGQAWRVASLTRARVGAAEGELPRPPQLEAAEHLIADLRNAQDEVATLDYGASPPQWSVGRAVRLADLGLSGLREDSGATLASRALTCPSCGATLEPRLDTTKSIVCGQCHAVVDISAGAGADLAHYAQAHGTEPQIPLGSSGQLAFAAGGTALPWQVVGYQERCDLPEPGSDEEQVFWREYLLFNRLEGFAFLVDTEEGWSLVRPLTGAPRPLGDGAVEWQGQRFRQRWRYRAKTVYVLGEFYWRVQQEDHCEVADYEGAALALSSERSGQELTWSLGRKLDAAEVMRAFKLAPERQAAIARDVGAFRPDTGMLRKAIIATAVIFMLIALMSTCSRDECQDLKDTYGAASTEYQQCRSSGNSGLRSGSRGGAWGGSGSSGGGHK
jgi:hypothetical protein